MKYTIVGEMGTKKQEVLDLVKELAKKKKMECNSKTKKLFKEGTEVGSFTIDAKMI